MLLCDLWIRSKLKKKKQPRRLPAATHKTELTRRRSKTFDFHDLNFEKFIAFRKPVMLLSLAGTLFASNISVRLKEKKIKPYYTYEFSWVTCRLNHAKYFACKGWIKTLKKGLLKLNSRFFFFFFFHGCLKALIFKFTYEKTKLNDVYTCNYILIWKALFRHNSTVVHCYQEKKMWIEAVEALIFFRLLSNCLNWKIYCNDHSSLSI